ncbi:MFS transporter [Streptomyces sulfonofaciens]|uniref:MFS transporter n=1 Tax=Streptomyces sulfonofaciens TaxID=68272 RepID=A0A919L7J6_9ACTN|nr:MFS transporter [Streptomyces sulfonofaciens]
MAALGGLPPRIRVVMAANLISSVGTGLVQPFLVLYLTEVRGLPVGTATAVISVIAAASLAGSVAAGRLMDGRSARAAAGAAMTVAAAGTAGFALVTTAWGAVLAGLAYGLAYGAMVSVWNTVIALGAQGEHRATAFGLQFVGLNAGVGLGGVLGGVFASTADPDRFTLLYAGDGLSFLVAGVVLVLAIGRQQAPDPGAGAPAGPRGYRVVLRDRGLLQVLAFTVVLMVVGYGQLESSIPGLVAVEHMDPRTMAWAFVANTCCIVLIQFAAITRISRGGPARLLAGTAGSWALCWLLLLLTTTSARTGFATGLVVTALAVFAVGEALLSVALPTLVNNLADDAVRGRYNGAYSAAMSAGLVIGPLLGGGLLTGGPPWLLASVLGLGCVLCACCALLLGRRLPQARWAASGGAGDPRGAENRRQRSREPGPSEALQKMEAGGTR